MQNLMMDFYELSMSQIYYREKMHQKTAIFDVFFRRAPDGASFAVVNGIRDALEYLQNLRFDANDIEYLRRLNKFNDEFLNTLAGLKFTGDVWAIRDGTVVLPNEPLLTVRAPLMQAQIVETAILTLINHASLITTKANRIVRAAKGRDVLEFGSRRAQGESAAVVGAKAAYIAGAVGTACVAAGQKYGIPVLGTMAHSFIQSYPDELSAFRAYAQNSPDNCSFLVDTYNVKQGVQNAIQINKEVLAPNGKQLQSIRIDSGDLVRLTRFARSQLDVAGLKNTKIIVSGGLDEFKISALIKQGAPIDSFGVGERMITAKSDAVFGGVYKMSGLEENGQIVPKIKISEDSEKVSLPGFKKVIRYYRNGKIAYDLVACYDEPLQVDAETESEILTQKVMEHGKIIQAYSLDKTRQRVREQVLTVSDECKSLTDPQPINMKLSAKLANIKNTLLK